MKCTIIFAKCSLYFFYLLQVRINAHREYIYLIRFLHEVSISYSDVQDSYSVKEIIKRQQIKIGIQI